METFTRQDRPHLRFCRRWWRMHKRMIEPYSLDQALSLYNTSQPYTIVVGDPEHPTCFIEVGEYPCLVEFLDGCKRSYMNYDFKQVQGDNLFLNQIERREFQDDVEEELRRTIYQFSETGQTNIYTVDTITNNMETIQTTADLSDHYLSIPKFGEYAELIRKREIKVKS